MREVEVGDNVFSKNGTEFNCTVIHVGKKNVTLEYEDNYPEECTVPKSALTRLDDDWEMPNWTASFDQIG